jgi:hypothetical protein
MAEHYSAEVPAAECCALHVLEHALCVLDRRAPSDAANVVTEIRETGPVPVG